MSFKPGSDILTALVDFGKSALGPGDLNLAAMASSQCVIDSVNRSSALHAYYSTPSRWAGWGGCRTLLASLLDGRSAGHS